MRDGALLARALTQGWVECVAAPELDDPATRDDVAQRLGLVGHELVRVGDCWLARPRDWPPEPAVRLRSDLDKLGLAIVCACYLHLVFLPAEHEQRPLRGGDSIRVDEITDLFVGQGVLKRDVERSLRRVCHGGWVRRSAGRLFAEPPLMALDEQPLHDGLALRLMRYRIGLLGRNDRDAVS